MEYSIHELMWKEIWIMQTIREVKDFLDKLRESEPSPAIAHRLRLAVPGIGEMGCQCVEQELSIRLPESYRNIVISYNLSNLELGFLSFFGSAQALIDENQALINPFAEFYSENHLLEIGGHESDRICVQLENQNEREGKIVYIDHAKYPNPEGAEAALVCSDLERLIVCAAMDLKLKQEASYYKWTDELIGSERENALFHRIMDAILQIEPSASETSFWYGFIRGF